MEIYKPGTRVKILSDKGDIPAVVDRIGIGYNGAIYTLRYYVGNELKEVTCNTPEFSLVNQNESKTKIGFICDDKI
jgi:hypothetical protein